MSVLGISLSRASTETVMFKMRNEITPAQRLSSADGAQEHEHPNTVLGKGMETTVQIILLHGSPCDIDHVSVLHPS